MTARAHHFVPRCSLKNFTTNKKITLVDLDTGDEFTTNPENVAQERDFNRIETDDLAPDALEMAHGQFEGELAPILQSVVNGNIDATKEDFDSILNLVALLAIRNPRYRSPFSEFQDNVRQQILQLTSATKERWEAHIERANAARL
ncbi:DUF4238 domain-containing protein [Bradyrhizobium sp. B117]|uniref:DUF4238 domain-containing protein n=1 Tax=Bradyrhizobium sp. B117 TaxID=3140246 RepID=UPI0031841F2F